MLGQIAGMDTSARAKVRKILDTADETARSTVLDGKAALFARYSPLGLFHSDTLIKGAVRLFENEVASLITEATDRVATVAQDIEAFAMIAECVMRFDRFLAGQLESVAAKASGSKPVASPSVDRTAKAEFSAAQARWQRQLELHRFSFVGGPGFPLSERPKGPPSAAPTNRGGKPLAAHWDAMWAAIAVGLWTGELKPKSQADVKSAMFDWFNQAEIDVGDTALTQRARQLWQAMLDAEG